MSIETPVKMNDRVEVLMHSRTSGYMDTGGGWSSDWVKGKVVKVNKKTATVLLDKMYFHHFVNLPFRRIRLLT